MSEIDCMASIRKAKGDAGMRTFHAAKWLHLAAAPTFAAMALLTPIMPNAQVDMLCSSARDMPVLGGMTAMYLLMGVFHTGPWLRRLSSWRGETRRRARYPEHLQ